MPYWFLYCSASKIQDNLANWFKPRITTGYRYCILKITVLANRSVIYTSDQPSMHQCIWQDWADPPTQKHETDSPIDEYQESALWCHDFDLKLSSESPESATTNSAQSGLYETNGTQVATTCRLHMTSLRRWRSLDAHFPTTTHLPKEFLRLHYLTHASCWPASQAVLYLWDGAGKQVRQWPKHGSCVSLQSSCWAE